MTANEPLMPPAPPGADFPLGEHPEGEGKEKSLTLYIALGPDGAFKVGTCAHCVIDERGRPPRAWEADGDRALDFDRDTLFAHLAELGIQMSERQAYVCP